MTRDLAALARRPADLLVIGGGILGACVAWDAALRGLDVILAERDDFASGASGNCLKIVHGGLRYLKTLDLPRLRSSAAERSRWLRLAPHLVEPLPVLVPAYRSSGPGIGALRAALAANDALTCDRNRGLRPDRRLPRGRIVSRRECLDLAPEVDAPGLVGGALFHDACMYSAERLVLEVILAAHAAGARVANHLEFEAALAGRDGLRGARLRDRLTGATLEARAALFVNAAGGAAPAMAARLSGRDDAAPIRFALATNLVVRGGGRTTAFAVAARDEGRQLFVVPWRDRTLIGTFYHADDGAAAEGASLRDDLAALNAAWTGPALRAEDVLLVHRGRVPIAPPPAPAARVLTRPLLVDHARHGAPWALTAVSVKYTTARRFAETIVDRAAARLRRRSGACRTARTPLPGAGAVTPEETAGGAAALPGDDETRRHLARAYGSRAARIGGFRDAVPDWSARVVPGAPDIVAQLLHGAREEMAITPEDLVWRRTEVGARGLATQAALDRARRALDGG